MAFNYKPYSGSFIVNVKGLKLSDYEVATTKTLKPNGIYYWYDKRVNALTHKLVFEAKRCFNKQYIEDIRNQINKGIIWIKRVETKKAVVTKKDNGTLKMF